MREVVRPGGERRLRLFLRRKRNLGSSLTKSGGKIPFLGEEKKGKVSSFNGGGASRTRGKTEKKRGLEKSISARKKKGLRALKGEKK